MDLHLLKAFAFVIFVIPFSFASAQNLVPNPSFEDHLSCPNSISQVYRLTKWAIPANHQGTPDYYHRCGTGGGAVPTHNDGDQEPRTGDAYIGLIIANVNYNTSTPIFLGHRREYLQVELDSALQMGQSYWVEAWVSCSDRTNYVSDRFGFHFSDTLVEGGGDPDLIHVVPQVEHSGSLLADESDWVQVGGVFVANGGEQFLTIGNFRDTTLTTLAPNTSGGGFFNRAHILIDDVSVTRYSGLGIDSEWAKWGLEVFPTRIAAGKELTVRLKNVDFGEGFELLLFDLAGRIVDERKGILAAGAGEWRFVPPGVGSGVYFLQVMLGESRFVRRVVFE